MSFYVRAPFHLKRINKAIFFTITAIIMQVVVLSNLNYGIFCLSGQRVYIKLLAGFIEKTVFSSMRMFVCR
jgi:hypothetical protein